MQPPKKTLKEDNHEEIKNKKGICFVIMPISDCEGYDKGHFGRVYEHLFKPSIEAAGYKPERADIQTANNIILGIIKSITHADMVLCDLSSTNPNVLYELGLRNAFEKPVILAKDEKTKNIFDITTMRYHEYHSSLRADYVERDIVKLTNAIKNYQEDKLSYSLMQQASVTNAELPPPKAVDSSTIQILSSLDTIVDRLRNLERGQARDRHYSSNTYLREKEASTMNPWNKLDSYVTRKDGTLLGRVVRADSKGVAVIDENTNELRKFTLAEMRDLGLDFSPF